LHLGVGESTVTENVEKVMSASEPIRTILIVGGGTAGWLSAAYLNRALGDAVQITVVESAKVGAIGVGEATIPSLRVTMAFLGLRDQDWMPFVGATYKAAIKFENWSRHPDAKSKPTSYWHPFASRPEPSVLPYSSPYAMGIGERVSLLHYALKRRLEGASRAISEMLLPTQQLCEAKLAPVHPEQREFCQAYAFHLDVSRLGTFLRDLAIRRGVKRIVDHVRDVDLKDQRFIAGLRTNGGQCLQADLYLDCTGFRGVLLNDALKEPFESDSHRMLCDSAVAIACENNPDVDGIKPYTTATALDHGWSWDVPLMHRNGCGYVYSSSTIDADAAETELRDFLGGRSSHAEANHIKMRVGSTRNAWVGNCVGIGLSSCFIEPLESTGIALIEAGLAGLVSLFPDCGFSDALIRRYNTEMRYLYEETRDFIILHYVLSDREDTAFWRAVKYDTDVPDTLREKLEFFEYNLPALDDLRFSVFRAFNYTCILDGNSRLPKAPSPLLEQIGYDLGNRKLDDLRAQHTTIAKSMPDHFALLQMMNSSSGSESIANV